MGDKKYIFGASLCDVVSDQCETCIFSFQPKGVFTVPDAANNNRIHGHVWP